jgi:predicted regulator of Ras-like GTPase activity (Roadblock/LC7/MglB family)
VALPEGVFTPSAISAAASQLEAFTQLNPDVKLVVLTSGDGFEIAAHPPQGNSARIAAMSSSMQALAHALTHEAGLARGRSLIIETDTGTVLVFDLDDSLPRTSLAVVATAQELLGKLLWASRNLCKVLEQTLGAQV